MDSFIYAICDGDNIRQRMESELLYGDLDGCRRVSESIVAGMEAIRNFASENIGWEVIFLGGDDALIQVDLDKYSPNSLREMANVFQTTSGSSLSIGAGRSLQEAYINLRRAKTEESVTLCCETEITLQSLRSFRGE